MSTNSTSKEKQEILNAYLDYFDAYSKRQWERMVLRFAKEFTMFGTGIDERSRTTEDTLAFYKREFLQSPSNIDHSINTIEVFLTSPTSAYLTVVMDMQIKLKNEQIECKSNRSTVIMVKEEGDWKIAHGHWSQPAEGQDVGDSIPFKMLKERNKQLEEKVAERTQEIEKQNQELLILNDTKTKLLSIIAHDLRSPFNAFMGLTEVMLLNFDNKLNNPDYFKTRLKQIHERASHLYNVADNLLNWAWTQTEEISINWTIAGINDIICKQIVALEDIAKNKEILFTTDFNEEVTAFTDPEILGIILRNFLSNAVKYSHRSSRIDIKAKQNGQHTLITISDKGIGMDTKTLKNVLSTNSLDSKPGTEKEKGTGLGLQISQELINRINGTLCIDSTPEIGTKISISLPASEN